MSGEPYFDRTDEENYTLFLNALAGVEDDAGTENYSCEGISHLRAALAVFRAEYAARHKRAETPDT